jgi:hypothetical protein
MSCSDLADAIVKTCSTLHTLHIVLDHSAAIKLCVYAGAKLLLSQQLANADLRVVLCLLCLVFCTYESTARPSELHSDSREHLCAVAKCAAALWTAVCQCGS